MLGITGASGQLGQHIGRALLSRAKATQLRLGSRTPATLASFAAAGAETRRVDFDDPASLAKFFDRVKVALIISGDGPNDRRVAQHEAAFAAAKRAGVERIVYTSFANPHRDSLFSVAASHADSEAILQALDIDFTILRNCLYAENVLVSAAHDDGELAQPGAHGKVAYISCADAAEAAAGAMVGATHARKTYEITGCKAIDQFEIAAELSLALGREIKVVELPADEYRKLLLDRGLPPFVADLIASLRMAVGANEYARVTNDAELLAERPIESPLVFLRREAIRLQALHA